MARAFVLSVQGRAALAVALVALSVAYAVLTGAAAGGLAGADEALTDRNLTVTRSVLAEPGLAPFPRSDAPAGATILAHATAEDGTVWGTIVPWPYNETIVPQPYARVPEARVAPLPVGPARASVAPWTWVLLPPAAFDAAFPDLAGDATMLVLDGAPEPGDRERFVSPAATGFYGAGAQQVVSSVHLVVAAMGFSVAILSAAVLQLEVLARERDLATLESLGGRKLAARAIVLRAAAISGAGVILGLALGYGLAAVASRAIGGAAFHVDPLLAAEAALVSFAAGVLAGSVSGLARLRAPLTQRLGRRGSAARPFRGPVRFLLVTPRVFASAFVASVVISSVSGVVLAAASIPYEVFEPGGDVQVLGRAVGNPFRGKAERFLGEQATLLAGINASSPEIFAPTMLGGKPVIVRGVHVDMWRSVDEVTLLEGRWPEARGEALVGQRAARVLDLAVGDDVLVPGSYRTTLQPLRIVGVHHAPGLLDDEIVTQLDVAADLAGLDNSTVNMIRVRAEEGAVRAALSGNLIVVTDLSLTPARPVPHTQAVASVDVLNLGGANGTRQLDVRANGILVASSLARLGPRQAATIDIPFLVPEADGLRIEVNPTLDTTTAPSTLTLEVPERVAQGALFDVRVLSEAGDPLAGVNVTAGDRTLRSNVDGVATFTAEELGPLAIRADAPDAQGGVLVYVVDPQSAFQPRLLATIASVTRATPANETLVVYDLSVTLVNIGGQIFEGVVNATLGEQVVGRTVVSLGVERSTTIPLEVLVPRGTTQVEVADLVVALPAPRGPGVPVEQRVKSVEDVLEERRLAQERGRDAQELRAEDFIADVFAGLEPSVAVVVLATFVHASAGVTLAVLRELREREEIRQTLRDIGASQDQVALRAVRDTVLSILPGLILGCLATWLVFRSLGQVGFPAAFGHTIPATRDWAFYARIVGGLALVATLTAFWTAYRHARAKPRQAPRAPLADLTRDAP